MPNASANYVWRDYDPKTMRYVEHWLDERAVNSTGLDDGFFGFYEYWAQEDGFVLGQNFWCKVVFENDDPFAVIAFCQHECKTIIMELLIAPEKRGQGKGSALLKELLNCKEIIGFTVQECEAIIYPGNAASQKAFENSGFQYQHNRKDEGGNSMRYVYVNNSTISHRLSNLKLQDD